MNGNEKREQGRSKDLYRSWKIVIGYQIQRRAIIHAIGARTRVLRRPVRSSASSPHAKASVPIINPNTRPHTSETLASQPASHGIPPASGHRRHRLPAGASASGGVSPGREIPKRLELPPNSNAGGRRRRLEAPPESGHLLCPSGGGSPTEGSRGMERAIHASDLASF
ncbi:hypothetical protein Cni_G03571 [Canna indica]|uniref:Uncharacterized protein n=1 Tax=Canna indica TaxID=4628 RepID=A0AAQ3JRP9_9LILI|nr:hypothetical protein Cni_G03571 [Canna indica]